MARFERLPFDVISQIQKSPPCLELEGGEDAKTLWDNYCLDQNRGPKPLLESAWTATFAPHLMKVVDEPDTSEATLLTFYCCWGQCGAPIEVVGDPPVGIYPQALTAAIMDEVIKLALNRPWRVDVQDRAGTKRKAAKGRCAQLTSVRRSAMWG